MYHHYHKMSTATFVQFSSQYPVTIRIRATLAQVPNRALTSRYKNKYNMEKRSNWSWTIHLPLNHYKKLHSRLRTVLFCQIVWSTTTTLHGSSNDHVCMINPITTPWCLPEHLRDIISTSACNHTFTASFSYQTFDKITWLEPTSLFFISVLYTFYPFSSSTLSMCEAECPWLRVHFRNWW